MKKLITTARTTEVDSVSDKAVLLFREAPALADDNSLKGIIDEISAVSDDITEAINRDQIYSDMEDVDAVVESDARTLKTILKGYAAMPDEELSAAAKVILDVVEKYNFKLFRESQDIQSSHVEALLMDLSADNIKEQAAVLPTIPETIEKLSQSQKNFRAKNAEFLKLYADNKDALSATKLKAQLLSLINGKLNIYLTSAAMLNPEKYGNYVGEMDKAIETVNQNVKSRVGSKKKKDAENQGE